MKALASLVSVIPLVFGATLFPGQAASATSAPSMPVTSGSSTYALAQAREDLAESLRPLQADLRAKSAAEFAGMWIDDSGTPQVRVVGDSAAIDASIARANVGASMVVRKVRFSEVALNEAIDRLRGEYVYLADGTLTLGGLDLGMVYVDLSRNAVVIAALSGSPAEWTRLVERYGPEYLVERGTGKTLPAACTGRGNCGAPMKAGLWMYFISGERACTTAFQAFAGTSNYILTAGHCHANSNTRYHPIGTKIGAQQAYAYTGRADAMSIYLSSASSVSNKLYLTPSNIISITRAEQIAGSVNAEVVGQPVCVSKSSAPANPCGYLQHNNVDLGGGLYMQRMASNFWVCGGDSGAPVFYGSKAVGIISQGSGNVEQCGQQGSNSFYSHIYFVQDVLNVALRIN